MAYLPPQLSVAGLTVPVYADIIGDLSAQYLAIYGQTIYLGTDTADYQWLSALCSKMADCMSCCQLAYNSRSPLTAVGAALDALGKVNGIERKSAAPSTASVTLTGTPGTVITNGVVSDVNGFQWDLPASVVIASGGTISVIAICETLGAIVANAATLTIIATPTGGWISVTNPNAIPGSFNTVGLPVETDSQFRSRQALSVALPSSTMLAGTVAAIAATTGVTRYNANENYFGFTASFGTCSTVGTALTIVAGYPIDSTDVGQSVNIAGTNYTISAVSSGTAATLSTSAGTQTGVVFYIGNGYAMGPKNSITLVVEGGADADVANAIYLNRGIGCYTNGSTSITVVDAFTGASMPMRFSRPSYVPIFVSLTVHGLTGYVTATGVAIKAAIVAYLNSLQLGELVVLSELYGAALTARPNPDLPMFSIRALTLGIAASPSGTSDLTMTYAQVAQGVLTDVVLTVV